MNTNIRSFVRGGLLASLFVVASGCGGSGGSDGGTNNPTTSTAHLSIRWQNPARDLEGPTSARSAVIRVMRDGANDIVQTVVRPAAGGNAIHNIANVPTGTSLLVVDFYAGTNGTGEVMRRAQGSLVVAADGTATPAISGTPEDTVASVEILLSEDSPTLTMGANPTLLLSAHAADGALVGIPDTRSWGVVSNATNVVRVNVPDQAAGNWTVTALAAGSATLTASLDGKTASREITVVASQARLRVANLTGEVLTHLTLGPIADAVSGLIGDGETGLFNVPPGQNMVRATIGERAALDLAPATFGAEGEQTLALFATGSAPDLQFETLTIPDTFSTDATFQARFVNLLGAEHPVDVYLTPVESETFQEGDRKANALAFRQTSDLVASASGSQTVWITEAGTTNVLASAVLTSAPGLKAYVYLVGDGFGGFFAVPIFREVAMP